MIDVESYARNLEAYLCRKNDGHLIRITGPAFEQVQGWASQADIFIESRTESEPPRTTDLRLSVPPRWTPA